MSIVRNTTVVFFATKHHVELYGAVLTAAGVSSAPVYGTLDPTARKINLARFRKKQIDVLVVTDVAARGLDMPLLDNVINFHSA
jgi:ATP-dependent RNA helicase DDX54/DBP10